LILAGISKNVLTKYGVGLLVGILCFGIIGYNTWVIFNIQEATQKVGLTPLEAEKERLLQELSRHIGISY
jgi:hypothetical protein